jgi:alkylation response protein AidB-like acyl-CoA dehydrogenase
MSNSIAEMANLECFMVVGSNTTETHPVIATFLKQAVRKNGAYILNGSKTWITNAPIADFFVIFAKTDLAAKHRGMTVFIVERDFPGVTTGQPIHKMGQHAAWTGEVFLQDVEVPAENRLGEEGQGLKIALKALDLSRLGMGALALGACERALEEAVKFSLEHIQFSVPIAQKQAIQNYVADAKAETEALRSLVTYTAWLADTGQDFRQQASITKLFGARAASAVTNKMLQVHGGYGYMKEYAIERYYRDCRALEIIEGTSQIQQFLIAREIYQAEGLEIKP